MTFFLLTLYYEPPCDIPTLLFAYASFIRNQRYRSARICANNLSNIEFHNPPSINWLKRPGAFYAALQFRETDL